MEKIHISFFEACFLILYFHACVCIYVTYMSKLVFNPKVATWFFPIESMGIFSDTKGQLTPQLVVKSCRISKYSKLSCMSFLPTSMKRIG